MKAKIRKTKTVRLWELIASDRLEVLERLPDEIEASSDRDERNLESFPIMGVTSHG